MSRHTAYLGDYTMLTHTRFGKLMYVDTRDVSISSHLIMSGSWEPWITDVYTNVGGAQGRMMSGETFVDVGANCGWYSLLAASMGLTVHSYEPNPRLCELMRKTRSVNGFLDTWSIHECALSSAPGMTNLCFTHDNQGGAFVLDPDTLTAPSGLSRATQRHAVEVRTLDHDLPMGTLVDHLKIDVEGHESAVLQGAARVLQENHRLLLSIEHNEGDRPMIEQLVGMGFSLGHFAHHGRVVPCTVEDACALRTAEMLSFVRGCTHEGT